MRTGALKPELAKKHEGTKPKEVQKLAVGLVADNDLYIAPEPVRIYGTFWQQFAITEPSRQPQVFEIFEEATPRDSRIREHRQQSHYSFISEVRETL